MRKYSRIFSYLAEYKGQLVLYTLFIILSTAFSALSFGLLMPFFQLIFVGKSSVAEMTGEKSRMNQLLNDAMDWASQHTGGDSMKLLLFICIFMLVSIMLKNLFLVLAYYILNPLKNLVVTKLRASMYEKILELPIGYFTERRKGDLMSRITNDINEVEGSVIGTMEGWVRDPIQIIFYLSVLLFMSWQLSLFIFLLLPIMGFIIGRISRSLKKQSNAAAILQGDTVSVLDETLAGLRVIKAFNAEKLLRNRFFDINNKLLRTRNTIGYRRDLASPLSETLGLFVFSCVLLYGGHLVLQNHSLSGEVLIGFLGMFYNIINPAKTLSTSFYNMQKGSAAIVRIEEVLKAPVVVKDAPNAVSLPSFEHEIEFRNVGFKYEEYRILKNINLTIRKGSTVALVGGSGAGKSTLADLVPRFHDVTEGELLIDGRNIREYSIESIRALMGIVTQEPILFNDSVAANISMGNPEATDGEIEQAAKVANAHSFIANKEDGYQTNIGDRGTKLSGGERQRMTIARAVLKNPPILILDEATSALDTESEKLVQDAIYKIMKDRTTLVIAHRLSTIRHADEIIVLQKGEIVERGTHQSLLEKGGYYSRLVEMQEFK